MPPATLLAPAGFTVSRVVLYEALALGVIATLLFRWRAAGVRDTQVLGRYLALAGLVRFGIEFIRVNERLVGPLTLAHMIALGDSIRALKRAGLEADARRLALEAVFAAWPRTAVN